MKFLICPKCGQQFKFEELFKHNEEEFLKYLNVKVEQEVNEKIKIIRNDVEKEFQLEKERILGSAEIKLQQEITKNSIELNKVLSDKKILEESLKEIEQKQKLILEKQLAEKETELLLAENVRTEQLKNQIADLQKKADGLKNEYDIVMKLKQNDEDLFQKELKDQLEINSLKNENLLQLKQKEWESKIIEEKNIFLEKENKLREQIKELEIKNAQNRIINSKVRGENFENEVEAELRKAFGIYDVVEKITTGDSKADYLLTIKNHEKVAMGKIVFELKNADWKDTWTGKLFEDIAKKTGDFGILVASSFNDKYKGIPFVKDDKYDNIWITDHLSFIFVAQLLRKIIEMKFEFDKRANLLGEDKIRGIYKEKYESLREFSISEMPILIKSFQKQFDDLQSISTSLDNNSKKILKTKAILETKFMNVFVKKIEDILTL